MFLIAFLCGSGGFAEEGLGICIFLVFKCVFLKEWWPIFKLLVFKVLGAPFFCFCLFLSTFGGGYGLFGF